MSENNYDNFEIHRLDIKKVIVDSIGIYCKGFKTFIGLSSIIFAINFAGNIVDYISAVNIGKYSFAALSALLKIGLFLLTLLVSYRAQIAIYMNAEIVADGKEVLVKKVYERARDVLGRYIGIGIQYGLILALPLIGIAVSYILIESYITKYLIIVLLLIPLIYFGFKYMYAPIFAILDYDEHEYFTSSKLLIKGDFLRVMIIALILGLISFVPYQAYINILFEYKKMTSLHKFIAASVNNLFEMFFTPFSYTVIVVMYLNLRKNKRL